MAVLYTNNAASTLSASITNAATSFSVASGQGALFPALSGSDYFYVTLLDLAGNIEIVKVTARTTDTFTVTRAQDGTAARAWSAADKVELRITKAMLDDFKTDTRSGYLPLSGGTLTGTARISSPNGHSYFQVNRSSSSYEAGISFMTGGSFYWWNYTPINDTSVLAWYSNGAIRMALTNTGTLTVNGYTTLHAGNYTSYSPSLTGTGASGTWGINISGNAATATTATSATDSTKLPLAGGTLTGKVYAGSSDGDSIEVRNDTASAASSGYITFKNKNGTGVYRPAARISGVNVDNAYDGDFLIETYSGGTAYKGLRVDENSNVLFYDTSGNVKFQWEAVNSRALIDNNVVLHAGNYTSYSPSLTGSGASGTWGINVTGSSSVASNLSNGGYGSGTLTWYQASTNWQTWTGGWASHLISNHGDGSSYYNQTLIMPFWGPPQYMRKEGGNNVGPWVILSTENYTNYAAPASHTHTFDSLTSKSGGTGEYVTNGAFVGLYDGAYTWLRGWGLESNRATAYYRPTGNGTQVLYVGYAPGSQSWETINLDATYLRNNGSIVLNASNYSSYALPLSGGVVNGKGYFRKAQTAGDYTTAALAIESYDNTATGIAFHISGVVGKFLEMRTNGTLYWNSDIVIHSGNYTNYAHSISTNPNVQGPGVLAIGNNGSYSFVQSHNGQPLNLNPVGNTVQISGNTAIHSGNYSNYALPIGGGTLTGSRPITFDTNAGWINVQGNTGGWAMGHAFYGSSGTYRGGFGALGGADALSYFFIGQNYDDATLYVYPGVKVIAQRDLIVNGRASGNYGNRIVVGAADTSYTMQDTNLRPTIQANGQYPVLSLNHTVTSNGNHGPTVQYTANGTGYQFVHGMNGTGTQFFMGYSNYSDWNPHNGIAGYNGTSFFEATTDGYIGLGAPGGWGGLGSGHPGYHLHVKGYPTATNGYAGVFQNLGGSNGGGWLFQNDTGNHSWGATAEFRVNGTGDRPSVIFSTAAVNTSWSVGFVTGGDDSFRISKNHGHRAYYGGWADSNGGWGTDYFKITSAGLISMSADAQGYTSPTLYVKGDIRAQRGTGATGVIYFGNSGGTYLYYDGSNYSMPSGQLDVNGNRVLTAGNYTNYTLPIGGGWYGTNLPGSRWGGYSVNGGEISFGRDLPNNGQMGILVDGCYVAGENNGFWSLGSDNNWNNRRGMYWDGSYLNFTTNTPTARVSSLRSDGTGAFASYLSVSAGHGDTRFQMRIESPNNPGVSYNGYLTAWVSEPGISWSFCGIGGNVNIGGQYYGRQVDTMNYATYIRWDTNAGQTQFWNSSGTPGAGGGQGSCVAYVGADGNFYATTSQHLGLHAGNYSSYAVPQSDVSTSGGGNVILKTASNGYLYLKNWIDVAGSGLFSTTTNGSHWYPADGSYGAWKMAGTRNGWSGIAFGGLNNGEVTLMVNPSSNETGFYNPSYGWQFRWMSGNLTVCKNTYGGGTEATVLDSSNYTNYTPVRVAGTSGYAHAGTGMYPFYNWGGTNGGASAPSDSSYTIGISVGSHPSDQAYGFQIARNMWNTGLWTRGYDSGWGGWVRLLDSSNYSSYALPLSGGTLTGVVTTVSSGTAINFSGQSDSFGYNATSGLGTYIKGTGSTYVYGGGSFYDGSAQRAILHAGNYSSYALPLSGGTVNGYTIFNYGISTGSSGSYFANVDFSLAGGPSLTYTNSTTPSANTTSVVVYQNYVGKTPSGLPHTVGRRTPKWTAATGGLFGTTYGVLVDEIFVGNAVNAYTQLQQDTWSFYSSYAGSMARHFIAGGASIGPGSSTYDNWFSAGTSSARYTVVYAVTGSINTSDINEKEQIQDLDAAELRVATAIKGLIKRFKWKDAVVKKGADARIHIGVIAQEVEQAFITEGLDPAKYALFCKDVWWEFVDENGSVETSNTEVEGGVRKERKGIRYDQLLAFVIAAI